MANYIPVTAWTVQYSTQSGTTWMGAAVRIVMDADASTASSYALYAECSAYQQPGRSGTYQCLWYYNGSFEGYHNATFTNSTGPVGSVYRASLGTFTAGQTATSGTWRYRIDFTDIGSRWAPTSGTVTASYTVPAAPADPTSITNTRNSDTSNTASWVRAALTFTRDRLQRIEDGTMTGEWTFPSATSYTDTLTSAGHSYTYRVRTELVPEAGEAFLLASDWVTSSATYNSPAAPTAIGGARIAASTVRVTLTNTASTSTGLEVQASTDPNDWSGALSQTYAGAGLQTADMTGISGIYYFRARNTRGALVSDWSPISDAVVTLVPPNPPTLTAPTGAVHNYTASQTMTCSFVHNPIDGSAQTAAEVAYSTDGGSTWTTQSLATQTSYTLTLTSSSLGKTYTWRARTKGADPSYSNWSSTRQITVYQQPTVTITLTDGNGVNVTNGTLTDMPLNYSAAITGTGTGSLTGGTFAAGAYTEAATVSGTTLVGSVTAAEAQPVNGVTYTVTITAAMDTGLTGVGSVTVTMAFADPQAGTLAVSDADGIETLTVGLEPIGAGEVAASSISVYRVTDSGTVLLASDLQAGDTITDRYAPLNTAYTYRVVTYSTAGASRGIDFANTIPSNSWMALWGEKAAYGRLDPSGGISVTRPKRSRQYFAGRAFPVSYDGVNTGEQHKLTVLLLTKAERDAFAQFMRDGGRGVYKSVDGYVFRADFEVSLNEQYTKPERDGTVTLTVTRIDGAAL